MNTEKLKQAALAAGITAHSVQEIRTGKYEVVKIEVPDSTILALLECVDALKDMLSEVEDGIATSPLTRVTARAALQKLGAL